MSHDPGLQGQQGLVWNKAAKGMWRSIQLQDDLIIGLGTDLKAYAQRYIDMTPESSWTQISNSFVHWMHASAGPGGSVLIGLGRDNAVYVLLKGQSDGVGQHEAARHEAAQHEAAQPEATQHEAAQPEATQPEAAWASKAPVGMTLCLLSRENQQLNFLKGCSA